MGIEPTPAQIGGYRVSHDRGAVIVGDEAPVWTSPAKPKSRMTTRSRHRLITGLLVNLTRHDGKLLSAGWTSMRHWAWLVRRTAGVGQVRRRGSG
jgi:hypothetical protein